MEKKFRDLKTGRLFEFTGRWLGMASGPWIKTGRRKYARVGEPAFICQVGTINAEVEEI